MITIRPYRPSDQPYLRTICRATAGDFFQRRRRRLQAVSILYNDYYTQCEPENVFVAADENDIPVGYILCSVDFEKYKREIKKQFLLPMVTLAPSMGFIFLLGNVYPLSRVERKYQTHLHIDILEAYQHRHIGSRLIDALRQSLADRGYDTLSVIGMDAGSDAVAFYKHYGFRELCRHPFSMLSLTIDC